MDLCLKHSNHLSSNDYVEISQWSDYNIYHSECWHNFIKKSLSWDVEFEKIYHNEKLVFILPYVHKFRQNLKKYKICLPFSHHVKPILKPGYEKQLTVFIKMIVQSSHRYEIHGEIISESFTTIQKNYITCIDLSHYFDERSLLNEMDYKSVRYMINRANKNNITIDSSASQTNLNLFYDLECETRRRQGAPIYPKEFFHHLFQQCKNNVSLIMAFYENKAVSGAIFFHNSHYTIYGYAASVSDKEIKKLGINEIVLWEGIKQSYIKGDDFFDFGTTPIHLEGLRKYKEKWGANSKLLSYSFSPVTSQDSQIKRDGKLVQLATLLFRHLPFNLYKTISPIFLKLAI